jgi:hypothetical protein
MSEVTTLGEALPREIERVQEIIIEYSQFPAGALAASMMKASVKAAIKAQAEGDVVQMLVCYEKLKGYEL